MILVFPSIFGLITIECYATAAPLRNITQQIIRFIHSIDHWMILRLAEESWNILFGLGLVLTQVLMCFNSDNVLFEFISQINWINHSWLNVFCLVENITILLFELLPSDWKSYWTWRVDIRTIDYLFKIKELRNLCPRYPIVNDLPLASLASMIDLGYFYCQKIWT